jgi:hypothetical protein
MISETRSLRLTGREDAGIDAASLPRLRHVVLACAGRLHSGKLDGVWRWGAGEGSAGPRPLRRTCGGGHTPGRWPWQSKNINPTEALWMHEVSPESAAWCSPGLALWLSAEPIAASHEAGSSHEAMAQVTFV